MLYDHVDYSAKAKYTVLDAKIASLITDNSGLTPEESALKYFQKKYKLNSKADIVKYFSGNQPEGFDLKYYQKLT